MKKKIIINLDANDKQEEIDLLIAVLKDIAEGIKTNAKVFKNKTGYFYQWTMIPDQDTPIDANDFINRLTTNQGE